MKICCETNIVTTYFNITVACQVDIGVVAMILSHNANLLDKLHGKLEILSFKFSA